MFGIGFPEMILILALALIVVGPDKLPDLARSIAKTIMDLKSTAEGLKDNLTIEDNPLDDIRPELEDAAKNFKKTILDAESHTSNLPTPPLNPDLESPNILTDEPELQEKDNKETEGPERSKTPAQEAKDNETNDSMNQSS